MTALATLGSLAYTQACISRECVDEMVGKCGGFQHCLELAVEFSMFAFFTLVA